MEIPDKPIANPTVVLREEFDDWAILFDPDTGKGFGLNPVSVFIWKRLDGEHTVAELIDALRAECDEVPAEVEDDVKKFIQELLDKGLAGQVTPAG